MGNQQGKAAGLVKNLADAGVKTAKEAVESVVASRAPPGAERKLRGPLVQAHVAKIGPEPGLQTARTINTTNRSTERGRPGTHASSNDGLHVGFPAFSTRSQDELNAEEVHRRVNERPALFKRLDEPYESLPTAPAVDVSTIGTDLGDADNGPSLSSSSVPLDPVNAEVAASISSGAGGEAVSVRKLISSSPAGMYTAEQRDALHAKDEKAVRNVVSLEGSITERQGDEAGQAALAVWDAMQLNPKLLDSAEALQRSAGQMLLAQMALGYIPPEARGDLTTPAQIEEARRKAPPQLMLGAGGADGSSLTAGGGGQQEDGLVPLAERIDSLVPAGKSLDELILQQPVPSGVAAWGSRPVEGSPYDQLILHDPDEPAMLDRNELFEMFARHRSDPDYWTHERLAAHYDTSEWLITVARLSVSFRATDVLPLMSGQRRTCGWALVL